MHRNKPVNSAACAVCMFEIANDSPQFYNSDRRKLFLMRVLILSFKCGCVLYVLATVRPCMYACLQCFCYCNLYLADQTNNYCKNVCTKKKTLKCLRSNCTRSLKSYNNSNNAVCFLSINRCCWHVQCIVCSFEHTEKASIQSQFSLLLCSIFFFGKTQFFF